MTTEQMDDKDAQRAGFKDAADQRGDGRERWPFTPNPDDSVKLDFYEQMELARRDIAAFLSVPVEAIQVTVNYDAAEEHTHHTREARDQCAAGDHKYAKLLDDAAEREKIAAHEKAEQDRIEREDGIVDITRYSEDTLRKVDAALFEGGINGVNARRDLISAMQNAGILFRERAPEYEPVPADEPVYGWNGVTEMAEEPIENRLRRAWLNGFKDGVDRASYATTESTGRWDY